MKHDDFFFKWQHISHKFHSESQNQSQMIRYIAIEAQKKERQVLLWWSQCSVFMFGVKSKKYFFTCSPETEYYNRAFLLYVYFKCSLKE